MNHPHGHPNRRPPWHAPPDHSSATATFALGVASIFTCFLLSPVAWALGHQTLHEIDRSGGVIGGRLAAKGGYIAGIIGTALLTAATFPMLLAVFLRNMDTLPAISAALAAVAPLLMFAIYMIVLALKRQPMMGIRQLWLSCGQAIKSVASLGFRSLRTCGRTIRTAVAAPWRARRRQRRQQEEQDYTYQWRWLAAKKKFDDLQRSYAEFECDALAILRLPALSDSTVPSTGRFIQARAYAQGLNDKKLPLPNRGEEYITAVETARLAWLAAKDAAERIRLPNEERSAIERVIGLLVLARESGSETERQFAYNKACSELSRLGRAGHVTVPKPAWERLNAEARGQLLPSKTT